MTDLDNKQFDDAKLWDLPSVDEQTQVDDTKTNAFNKPLGKWKYEAPEQEEDLAPLTAEDIEAIRSAAYQEGFEAGQKDGFEKGHQEGLESGKAEGFEQGKIEGLEKGESEAAEAANVHIQAISDILAHMQQPFKQVDDNVKQELVLLSVSLAKAILKTEISQSTESLEKIIHEAVMVLPMCDTHYHIHLHPQDLDNITEALGEQALEDKRWKLTANAQMELGGCKVVTDNNAVDMSIARRCEQVFSQLLIDQGLADDPRAS
jgi:flagellar assembly protein FliH